MQGHPATLTRPLKRMGYVYERTRSVPAAIPEASAVEAFCFERERAKGVAVGACRVRCVAWGWACRCVKGGLLLRRSYEPVESLRAVGIADLTQLGGEEYNAKGLISGLRFH